MPLSAMKGPEAADALSERAVGARHAAEAAIHPSPELRLNRRRIACVMGF